MNKILIVDDEKSIQRAIKRSFFGFPYEIFTASEATEALSVLLETEFDLIISDFKMPGMDGVDLLNIVKKKFPSIIRIIISGYIEKDKLMDTLFQFNVTSLIPKPWDDEILHEKVKSYIDLKNEIKDKRLWEKLNSHNLVSIFVDDVQEIGLLQEYILRRPHVYCGLLHLYNSEYYNGKKEMDIREIVKHFSSESIESLIQRSLTQSADSVPNTVDIHNPDRLLELYSRLGFEDQINCLNDNFVYPTMINIFRYILCICDSVLYNRLSESHFFLDRSESGIFSFNKSVNRIFIISTYFLRLWNITDQYLNISSKFLTNETFDFNDMEDCPKILFILDYYLEEFCEESLDIILEHLSKDLTLQQLPKFQ